MDFTFDNPFEDVFTDPNAVAPQAAPVVQQPAPVQPQPVANAQPYAQPAHQPQPGYGQPNNVGGGPNPAYQQPGGNAAQPGAQTTPATQPQFQPTPTGYGNPAMQQNTAPGTFSRSVPFSAPEIWFWCPFLLFNACFFRYLQLKNLFQLN